MLVITGARTLIKPGRMVYAIGWAVCHVFLSRFTEAFSQYCGPNVIYRAYCATPDDDLIKCCLNIKIVCCKTTIQ